MVFRLLFPLLSPKSKDRLSPQTSRGLIALIMRKRDSRTRSQDSLEAAARDKNKVPEAIQPTEDINSKDKEIDPNTPTNSAEQPESGIIHDGSNMPDPTHRAESPSFSLQSSGDHSFVDTKQHSREPTPEPNNRRSPRSPRSPTIPVLESEKFDLDHLGVSNPTNVQESYSVDTSNGFTGNLLLQGSANSTVFSDALGSVPTGASENKLDKPHNQFSPAESSPLGMQDLKDVLDEHGSGSDYYHSANEKHDKYHTESPKKTDDRTESSKKIDDRTEHSKKIDDRTDSSSISPPVLLENSQVSSPPSVFGKKNKKHSSLSLRRFFDKVKNHHHHNHHHHLPGAGAEKRPQSPIQEDSPLFQKYGSIGKHLGTGASGSVSLITLPQSNLVYAVKKFASKLSGETDNDFKIRVKNEFMIGEHLKHPNIIHTYDLIKDYPGSGQHHHHHKHGVSKLISEPQYFMVMEYCPYDFFNLVMSGLITTPELLCYFKQIVSGVNYMHDQGLAHRDLKLDNCVVNLEGILKLIDYGSAVHFRKELNGSTRINSGVDEIIDDKWKLVRARGVVGSDPYLAPEVLEPLNFGYDPRYADVWSCAVIFCCMVLRRFPWKLPKLSDPLYRSFVGISDQEAKEIEQNPIGITLDHNYNRDGKVSTSLSSNSRGPHRLLRHLPLESRNLISNMLKVDPKSRYLSSEVVKDPFFKSIQACAPLKPASNHLHHLVTEDELARIQKEEQREKHMKKAGMH